MWLEEGAKTRITAANPGAKPAFLQSLQEMPIVPWIWIKESNVKPGIMLIFRPTGSGQGSRAGSLEGQVLEKVRKQRM